MILLHENMSDEAVFLTTLVENLFNIPIRVIDDNLDDLFIPIPQFNGYFYEPRVELLAEKFGYTSVFLLTPRDLFFGDKSKEDEWVFGASFKGLYSVQSTARLLGPDSQPRSSLVIPKALYLRRLAFVTVHEIGHHVVRAPHFLHAAWVNQRSRLAMPLGPHCNDRSCVMFEVVDITAPPKDEGYLMLGNECIFDAGMDEQLGRLREDWFCPLCIGNIAVDESYRSLGRA